MTWERLPVSPLATSAGRNMLRDTLMADALRVSGWNQTTTASQRQAMMSRQIMGATLLTIGGLMASEGLLTGRLTDDPDMRNTLEASGVQEYSINIGKLMGGEDYWVSYQRTEPIGAFLAIAADTATLLNYTEDPEDAAVIAFLAVMSLEQYMLDQSFMQGVSDLFAVADPKYQHGEGAASGAVRYLSRILASAGGLAGSLGPGTPLSAYINRNILGNNERVNTRPDPNASLAVQLWESTFFYMASRTPGMQTLVDVDLPPLYDWLGHPIEMTSFGPDAVSPFWSLEGKVDSETLEHLGFTPQQASTLSITGVPTDAISDWISYAEAVGIGGELIRLGEPMGMPNATLRGIKLTPTQHMELTFLRGQGVQMRADLIPVSITYPDGTVVNPELPRGAPYRPRDYDDDAFDPDARYTMEEYLNALIKSDAYRDASDYTVGPLYIPETRGGRIIDERQATKLEMITQVRNAYAQAARDVLLQMHPDLAEAIEALKYGNLSNGVTP
jgi:hypothetical protein